MKRTVCFVVAALSCIATAAQAQVGMELHLGGGVTQPTGNFGDVSKVGWHGLVTFAVVPSHAPFAIQASGFYGQNNSKPSGGKWKFAGALGEVRLDLSTRGSARGYVMAGGGAFNVKATAPGGLSASETKGVFGGGVGFAYLPTPKVGVFIEARYLDVLASGPDFTFVPITAGVRIALK